MLPQNSEYFLPLLLSLNQASCLLPVLLQLLAVKLTCAVEFDGAECAVYFVFSEHAGQDEM